MTTTATPDIDTDQADWLAWRRQGIGASDVAAIVGLSPWESPWSLWAEKVGLTDSWVDTESTEFGRRAEPMIAPWFEDKTGLFVRCQQARVEHPSLTWARCTLDGRVYESVDSTDVLGGMESKTDFSRRRWDDIPPHYQAQGQWQMFVDETEHTWFPVLHGRRLEVYELARDDADIALLVDAAERFWHEHVVAGVPPLVDGSDATLRALQEVYPEHTPGSSVELDEVGRAAVRLLDRARAAKRDAEADEKAAKARLASILGDAEEGAEDGKRVVSYRSQDATRLDGKALRAEEPEIAAKYERTTSSRVMRTHLPKEKKS